MSDCLSIRPPILYVGTPVCLIVTGDEAGAVNLAPNSSVFALRDRLVVGMARYWRSFSNLLATGQASLNFPDASLWQAVERLAGLTGQDPVPPQAPGFRHMADKFGHSGLTPTPSETIAPPRVAECPIQVEATLCGWQAGSGSASDLAYLEFQWQRVHIHPDLAIAGTQRISPDLWSPLLYIFRHYAGAGPRLGRNYRAED